MAEDTKQYRRYKTIFSCHAYIIDADSGETAYMYGGAYIHGVITEWGSVKILHGGVTAIKLSGRHGGLHAMPRSVHHKHGAITRCTKM